MFPHFASCRENQLKVNSSSQGDAPFALFILTAFCEKKHSKASNTLCERIEFCASLPAFVLHSEKQFISGISSLAQFRQFMQFQAHRAIFLE